MKTIKTSEIIEFIDKIIDDENWVGDEYECYNIAYQYLSFVREYLNSTDLDYRYNRDELQILLDDYVLDFDDNQDNQYLKCELDDLYILAKRFCKELLPVWTDSTKNYCNLGELVDRYNLDIDELYFDGDGNCIRDKDGNIWWD